MYLDQGDPSEKCGELNFGLEYDFATQTLKLKINQVSTNYYFWVVRNHVKLMHIINSRRGFSKGTVLYSGY